MALVWKLDQPQYGPDGLVTLYRGDDWNLTGKVINLINGYEQPVDTSAYSATGYFPSASGGPDLPCAAATGACGSLAVSLPAASTPLVQVSSGGEGAYVVVADGMGRLQTIPMVDQSLAILDRQFST
jgi:hypothetical protein